MLGKPLRGPGHRPDRRAARHRICRAGDRDRRCAAAGPAQDFRHRLRQRRRRRHRRSAAGRSVRSMSICAGSAASCTAIPRSRRPASPPACSAIRRSASPGSPTSSASTASTLEAGPSRSRRLVHARGVRAQGRHAARRFRRARRHRRAVCLISGRHRARPIRAAREFRGYPYAGSLPPPQLCFRRACCMPRCLLRRRRASRAPRRSPV